MKVTYDYEGDGSDGSKLVHHKLYLARANGAPDKNGVLREAEDETFLMYKACNSGGLFCMRPQEPCDHGYVLPQYMEFTTTKDVLSVMAGGER